MAETVAPGNQTPAANGPLDPTRAPDGRMVDVRGPRFGAAITTVVLAVAMVVQGTLGTVLVAWQVMVFLVATVFGLRASPYGHLFRSVRRIAALGPPREVEPEALPRFAQACGLLVAGAGLTAVLLGASSVGWVLVGVVLALSTLLATTGVCIGCELYLVGARLRRR